MLDLPRLQSAYEKVREELLAERTPDGHWVGELSSSALATATAVSALAVTRGAGLRPAVGWDKAAAAAGPPVSRAIGGPALADSLVPPYDLDNLIRRGITYLASQQNPDGGFGDTDLSHSNIATTYLVVAAMHLASAADHHADLLSRADAYLESKGRLAGLRERYGIDKTFVVPIMTNLALAGLLDWREIDPLPFELACVPQAWYRFVGMPVVSYAIPALVAIGQARFHHAPPRNPLTRLIRWLSISWSLKVLRQMQPDSGGYLEATPLTAFVVMSLASKLARSASEGSGFRVQGSGGEVQGSKFKVQGSIAEEVIHHGVKFLAASIRLDGSWPIDTNLATWNTTLAINALAGAGEDVAELLGPQCLDWLLSCQHLKRHPFTGANPGGFGWSDLSGAVPDADDTPGAILAISSLIRFESNDRASLKRAVESYYSPVLWLVGLQNRNGGWPTFCRGWGKLPFDRSGVDLTAHALRALAIARRPVDLLAPRKTSFLSRCFEHPTGRGMAFLSSRQNPDGSWSPLWFGNQDHPQEDNPVYGTAKVLFAYRDLGLMDLPEAQRGVAWLVANQNADGGWGSGVWGQFGIGDLGLGISETQRVESQIPNPKSQILDLKSSVEETALAVEALLAALPTSDLRPPTTDLAPAVARGLNWLLDRVESGQHRQPAPIGFYFAKLWYYERLYPLTFTVAALGRARLQFAPAADSDNTEQPHATRAT